MKSEQSSRNLWVTSFLRMAALCLSAFCHALRRRLKADRCRGLRCQDPIYPDIVGVTPGWDFKPHLLFRNGKYLPRDAELLLYPEFFKLGVEWPTHPRTGEKLPLVKV